MCVWWQTLSLSLSLSLSFSCSFSFNSYRCGTRPDMHGWPPQAARSIYKPPNRIHYLFYPRIYGASTNLEAKRLIVSHGNSRHHFTFWTLEKSAPIYANFSASYMCSEKSSRTVSFLCRFRVYLLMHNLDSRHLSR